MPIPCTLCSDSRRAEIDASIRSGLSFRAVGRTYGLTKDVVGRHARACCGVAVASRAQVDEIFQEARAVNDHRLALAADKARGEIAGDAARLQGFEKTASPLVEVHVQLIQQKLAALSDAELDAVIRGGALPALDAAVETIDGDAA